MSANFEELEEHLKWRQQVVWAITPPPKISKKNKKNNTTVEKQKLQAKENEKKWGNKMIGQQANSQWTTLLGEKLVHHILSILKENPTKVDKKDGLQPDRITNTRVIEVKTRNWYTDGTAGEKVLGTWMKYQDIPELYGKRLDIVCVAFQEYELQYGKFKFFGNGVSSKTKQALDLAKEWDIRYIRFSDLISPLLSYELTPFNKNE